MSSDMAWPVGRRVPVYLKHGLVPLMPRRPPRADAQSLLLELRSRHVEASASKRFGSRTLAGHVWRILVICLGEPPVSLRVAR